MRLAYDYSHVTDAPNLRKQDWLVWWRTGKTRYIFTVRVYRDRNSGIPGTTLPVRIQEYGYNPTKECE